MTRLAASALACLMLLPGCDSGDTAPAAPAAKSKPAKPATKPEAAEPVAKSKPAEPKPEAKADTPETPACDTFSFTVGETTRKDVAAPSDDNPVGETEERAPLTLNFKCDGKGQTLALGDLELLCEGAACGSGCIMHDETRSACDFDLQSEDLAAGLKASVDNELVSWLVLTGVGRATIDAYEVYRVQKTAKGFDVLRERYASGDKQDSSVVASHPSDG